MQWLRIASAILYCVLYPLYFVASVLLYVLYILATPFVATGRMFVQGLMLPYHFLAKFEALWIFLAFAVLTGIASGLILHLAVQGCSKLLDLNRKPTPKQIPALGHDAASYRASREERKRKEEEKAQRIKLRAKLLASQPLIKEVVREARYKPISGPTSSPISPHTGTDATRSGLFNQTILEHTDEEDDSAF